MYRHLLSQGWCTWRIFYHEGVPTPPKSVVVYLEDILPWGVPTPPKSVVVYLEDILPWGVPIPPKSVVVHLEDILP